MEKEKPFSYWPHHDPFSAVVCEHHDAGLYFKAGDVGAGHTGSPRVHVHPNKQGMAVRAYNSSAEARLQE